MAQVSFDRKTFFDLCRTPVFGGSITQQQVDGLNSLLGAWEAKPPSSDLHWLAYCLGTTYWETGKTFQPVEEYGKGKGHSYGVPTGPWHQVYDGRGDVQLTFLANYTKATARLQALGQLSLEQNLAETPSLALQPSIAADILFLGMAEGWFTGKKLSDYFNSSTDDWVNARKIVNGLDHASTIAGYGMNFLPALQKALAAGVGQLAVTKALAPPSSASDRAADDIILANTQALHPAASTGAASVGPTAVKPGNPVAQQNGDMVMDFISVLTDLFEGVSGKISVAGAVMTALPNLVEGTVADLGQIPAIEKEFATLISDLRAGKWSNAPADIEAVFGEFTTIIGNYGISLPSLTSMTAALPATPQVTAAPVAPPAAMT